MAKSSTSKKVSKSQEARRAWLEARIANYANTRTPSELARMLIECEERAGVIPEFEIDEEWPEYVEHMRVK